jgi:uncharacterized RDD family membrane protein YckC
MRLVAESRLTIHTPEGVEFTLPLAGAASRMAALVIDMLLVAALSGTVSKVAGAFRFLGEDFAVALGMVGYFAMGLGYPMAAEWYLRGQTFGKRVMGLRVVDARGGRLQPSQVVLRNLLRAIDLLPLLYLVGGVAALWSPARQRLGDLVAGTIVTQARREEEPELDQVLGGKFNSLAGNLRWSARLRQQTPPELASAAMEALVRRDSFEPQARVQVLGALAAEFRRRTPPPAEAADFLSEEQYVRNVVEVLFRCSR